MNVAMKYSCSWNNCYYFFLGGNLSKNLSFSPTLENIIGSGRRKDRNKIVSERRHQKAINLIQLQTTVQDIMVGVRGNRLVAGSLLETSTDEVEGLGERGIFG